MSDNLWNQSGVISTELHQFMGGDIIPSCINASNLLDHKVGATKQNVILFFLECRRAAHQYIKKIKRREKASKNKKVIGIKGL